ncbi:MAG: hypothetical protein JW819_06525 [Candidatus Krumholzibacteriota bacterium]|nr:hypothetical protein [Candidatus Krumholzibacteriota bacterium]
MPRRFAALAALILLSLPAAAGELTFANWNLLNFPGTTGAARAPYFRTALAEAAPDLLVCQEVLSASGAQHFFDDVLDILEPGLWEMAPFHDSYDTDRALFIRDGVVEVLDWGWLDTDLRDIEWWDLRLAAAGDTLRLYSTHLKAGSGSTEEQRRLAEVQVLRADLDALPPQRAFIFCGDLNIYFDTEPAYQLLLSAGPGQLFDPIGQTGYWHDNASYAPIHTQSTRTSSFGGGATGGMDDRFDQVLVSAELLDGLGLDVLPATYLAFGQDGNHFNQSIINGGNSAVPPEVANALHEASDHLPVLVDLGWPTAVADGAPAVRARLAAWPNPFNPAVRLAVDLPRAGHARLAVYDTRGRRVANLLDADLPAGERTLTWRPANLASGLYLARLDLDGAPAATARLLLLE